MRNPNCKFDNIATIRFLKSGGFISKNALNINNTLLFAALFTESRFSFEKAKIKNEEKCKKQKHIRRKKRAKTKAEQKATMEQKRKQSKKPK